jgi:hypothetical protein
MDVTFIYLLPSRSFISTFFAHVHTHIGDLHTTVVKLGIPTLISLPSFTLALFLPFSFIPFHSNFLFAYYYLILILWHYQRTSYLSISLSNWIRTYLSFSLSFSYLIVTCVYHRFCVSRVCRVFVLGLQIYLSIRLISLS